MPPEYDEHQVTRLLERFGCIKNVQLARNLRSAKRLDFAFVIYEHHRDAVACVKGSFFMIQLFVIYLYDARGSDPYEQYKNLIHVSKSLDSVLRFTILSCCFLNPFIQIILGKLDEVAFLFVSNYIWTLVYIYIFYLFSI